MFVFEFIKLAVRSSHVNSVNVTTLHRNTQSVLTDLQTENFSKGVLYFLDLTDPCFKTDMMMHIFAGKVVAKKKPSGGTLTL